MKTQWIKRPDQESMLHALGPGLSLLALMTGIYLCLIAATNHMPPSAAELAASVPHAAVAQR